MPEFKLPSILVAVSLVFLVFNIRNSAGFKCYQCNSFVDPSCGEGKPNPDTLKECNGDEEILVPNSINNCSNNTGTNSTEEIEDCSNYTASLTPPVQKTLNFTICRKIVTEVFGHFVYNVGDTQVTREHKKSRVTRQCGYERARPEEASQDNACVRRRNGGSYQLTCSCTEEECNGAERMGLTTLSLLLMPLSYMLQL